MKLKIRLEDIPPEGLELPVNVEAGQALKRMKEAGDEAFVLADPVTGRVRFDHAGNRVVLKGAIRTALRAVCARCLEEFDLPIAEEVLVVFTAVSEKVDREELEAESLSMELIRGENIDLWPVIEEQLVMARPIKALCREDCRGFCPKCGADLNAGPCGCSKSVGHPAFGALKDIRDKLT